MSVPRAAIAASNSGQALKLLSCLRWPRSFGVVALTLALALSVVACSSSQPSDIGAATLTWSRVTRSTDGAELTNLAGYKIHYGKSANSLNKVITVPNSSLALPNSSITFYQVTNLSPGTWYFAVTAYSADGKESELSPMVSKTVR
jgi:hypothetical protein